ncbi:MAG: STAS domain-containing protein [Proteobacteria bacterium]|nr:STAS domain-containing protein [Pseudomonadota bacterium]
MTEGAENVTIHISGRFDYHLIKDFQQVLSRTPRTWVVDLTDVDYLDSSALGMLLLLRERVAGASERVELRGVHGQPREVLLMARFERMFKVA